MKYNTKYLEEKMKEYEIDYTLDEEVIDSTTPIKVHCNKCGKEYEKAPYIILNKKKHACLNCEDIRRFKKGEEFVKNRIKEQGVSKIISDYTGYYEKITLQCLKNKNHIWDIEASRAGIKGCPFCANKKVLKGDNTLGDLHPELLKYFKDEEEAFTVTPKSAKKLHLICPDCGIERQLTGQQLVGYNFHCLYCSDNISRPNKFCRSFLLQAEQMGLVDVLEQEWNEERNNEYKFDSYFVKDGIKYCVEMQGIQHKNGWNGEEESKKEIQRKDREKKEKAKELNYVFIEVECDRTDFGYIYNSFTSNEILKILFDFSLFNWEFIKNSLDSNIRKEVCKNFDEDLTMTIPKLSKLHKVNEDTIRKYLRQGEYFGWCDLIDNKYRAKWSDKSIKRQRVRRIVLFKDNKIIDYFSSLSEVQRFLKNIGGKEINIDRTIESQREICGYRINYDYNLTREEIIELEDYQHQKQDLHKEQRRQQLKEELASKGLYLA